MIGAPDVPFLAAADSAQAVATVYTASLLATVPIVLAAAGALLLRRASAEGRVLVWRSAVVALLLVFIGRQLPLHWVKAAEVPEARRYDVPGMPAPSTAQPCRPSNSVHYPGVLSQAL